MRLRIIVATALFLSTGIWCLADDVKINAFYPSPYGRYNKLSSTGEATLATTSLSDSPTALAGIGRTNPAAPFKLDVAGGVLRSMRADNSSGSVYLSAGLSSSNSGRLGFNFFYDRASSNWLTGANGSNNAASFIQSDKSSSTLIFSNVPPDGGTANQSITETSLSDFETMRIFGEGNVGIGTNAPQTKLAVEGTLSTGLYGAMLIPSQGAANSRRVGLGNNLYFDSTTSTWIAKGDGTYNGGAAILTDVANGNIGFFTVPSSNSVDQAFTDTAFSDTQKMAINSSGFVGIGTATPATPLDIYKPNFRGGLRVKSSRVYFDGEDTNNNFFIRTGPNEGNAPFFRPRAPVVGVDEATENLIGWKKTPGFANRLFFVMGLMSVGNPDATSVPWGRKNIYVSGALRVAGVKTFDIQHPDPGMAGYRLRHSCVESPTRGDNLYRYEIFISEDKGQATIELPSYFKYLNEDPQIWVKATDQFARGYGVINKELSTITVYGEKRAHYNVLLIGTRKDSNAMVFDKHGAEYSEKLSPW